MSAYKRIECSLTDKTILISALNELGFDPMVLDTPQKLRGFQDDLRSAVAEIIVPKEQLNKSFTGASNDLGFLYNHDTKNYTMVISDFDAKLKVNQRVVQAYAKVAIQKALESQGFEVETTPASAIQQRDRRSIQIVGEKLI